MSREVKQYHTKKTFSLKRKNNKEVRMTRKWQDRSLSSNLMLVDCLSWIVYRKVTDLNAVLK